MAFFLRDGFDLYASASDLSWRYALADAAFSNNSGRFGGGCIQVSPLFTQPLGFNFGAQTEIWSGFAMEVTSTQTNDEIVCTFVTDNSLVESCISWNPTTGLWKAFVGPNPTNGTLVGSATKVLSNGYHWIDVHMKRDTAAGIFEVWVDDAQVLNLTGVDNKTQTSNNMVMMTLGNYSGAGLDANYDDWHIQDTTTGRIGDSRIVALVPSSDASPNQGTPSTGTDHYACVDEAQWSSTNYITMPNTSGDKEVFGFSSLASTPSVIWGLDLYLVSEKSDAGSFQLEPLIISSTHEADGAAQQLTTGYNLQMATFDVDPNTSAAWTYAAINAMKAGYKVP